MLTRQKENQKNRKEKLADINYVASHAVVCLSTDFTALISDRIQRNISPESSGNLVSHLAGEALGDIAAVPATIIVQRFAPELTASIRSVMEPFVGFAYEASAEKEAAEWAKQHGISSSSEEYEDRKNSQYEHEISKMPMGIIWTVTSLGLNTVLQKQLFGNDGSYADITKSNIGGSLTTLAITNGLRLLTPHTMRKFDHFTNKHIAEPTTRVIESIATRSKIIDEEAAIQY